MSGYVGNKRSVSFVSAELPIRKGLESIVEEDGSYRLLDGASLKKSDGSTVIHSDGTIEGVDLSPIQNQIDSIEADITSLNSSVDLVEASVNQIPPRLESFRNRIINGDMRIDQRNAGSAITNPNVQFPVDRFGVSQYIADTTTQRSSDAPTGFKNSLLITNGTATAVPVSSYNYTCYQKIEGYNIDDLGFASTDAKSITVSFWVKTSLDATFAVSILNAAEDRSYVHTFEIENTNTWEYKSFTLTADQDTGSNWLDSTGTGLRLNFDLGSGADYNTSTLNAWQSGKKFRTSSSANFNNSTNATFYITGVQLEEGPVATPFEHRPYGLELSLCQRYFEKSYEIETPVGSTTRLGSIDWNFGSMTSYGTVNIFYKVTKRAVPTVKNYDPDTTDTIGLRYWNGSAEVQVTGSLDGWYGGTSSARWALGNTSRSNALFHWTAEAEL